MALLFESCNLQIHCPAENVCTLFHAPGGLWHVTGHYFLGTICIDVSGQKLTSVSLRAATETHLEVLSIFASICRLMSVANTDKGLVLGSLLVTFKIVRAIDVHDADEKRYSNDKRSRN